MHDKTWSHTAIYAALFLGVATPTLADTAPGQNGSVYAAAPTVASYSSSPISPAVKESIVFTVTTSEPANKVEFQFSGGSKQLMTASNGGRNWTYNRTEGLADANVKSFSVFINGSSTSSYNGTIQAAAARYTTFLSGHILR